VAKRTDHDSRYLSAIEMLRVARASAQITQGALAAKLGKRQQFVSKYESGERRLDVIEFLDIANALNMEVGALVRKLIAG
jgi:transcriptional regulator with XRE-family HTH domain